MLNGPGVHLLRLDWNLVLTGICPETSIFDLRPLTRFSRSDWLAN